MISVKIPRGLVPNQKIPQVGVVLKLIAQVIHEQIYTSKVFPKAFQTMV